MGQLQYIYNTSTSAKFTSLVCQSLDVDVQVESGFSVDNQPSYYATYFCFGNFNDSHNIVARRRGNGIMDLWFYGQHIGDNGTPPNFEYTTGDYLDVVMNVNDYYVNGTPLAVYGTPDPQGTSVSINMDGSLLCHFYYLRLKRNGTLLNEYVAWEENGVVGLKDLVSGTFYQPSSGTWTAGPAYRDDSNVVPINKYKLYTSNIQKTYNGSTQINKMYVGNDLVYRALPTTTPQLTIPLDEVWYKSSTNSHLSLRGGNFIDENGNTLTYTETFDTDNGIWKMKFSDNVCGLSGGFNNFNLIELYLPLGFVYGDDAFLYWNTNFKKFYGDSPSIIENGNMFINYKIGDQRYNNVIETSKDSNIYLTVPEGVTKLNDFSFKHTKFESITLPSTLTYIERYCFQKTTATDVYCYATTKPSVSRGDIWLDVSVAGTFHYPNGSDYSSFTVPNNWTKVGDL